MVQLVGAVCGVPVGRWSVSHCLNSCCCRTSCWNYCPTNCRCPMSCLRLHRQSHRRHRTCTNPRGTMTRKTETVQVLECSGVAKSGAAQGSLAVAQGTAMATGLASKLEQSCAAPKLRVERGVLVGPYG